MDLRDALTTLGVGPTSPWGAVRAAYLQQIRATHPDIVGRAGGETAVLLNEALRVVRAAVRSGIHPAPEQAPSVIREEAPIVLHDDDTLALVAPAEEVFDRLLVVLHQLGEVTYVDPDAGLLEALLELEGWGPSQLTVSLQGRGEATEAFFTLERWGTRPAPPLPDVVRLIARHLRAMAERLSS